MDPMRKGPQKAAVGRSHLTTPVGLDGDLKTRDKDSTPWSIDREGCWLSGQPPQWRVMGVAELLVLTLSPLNPPTPSEKRTAG